MNTGVLEQKQKQTNKQQTKNLKIQITKTKQSKGSQNRRRVCLPDKSS